MASAKWRPSGLGINVLKPLVRVTNMDRHWNVWLQKKLHVAVDYHVIQNFSQVEQSAMRGLFSLNPMYSFTFSD